MTCNRCHKAMELCVRRHRETLLGTKDYIQASEPYCKNPKCVAYGFLQVPMEMMPKEKRSEFYGDGYIEVEKPSKVRREKKDVGILGGKTNCKHKWMTVVKEWSGKSVSYEQCKKCNGVLYDSGNILVEG